MRVLAPWLIAAGLVAGLAPAAHCQGAAGAPTPAEAYAMGCGGCHRRETAVLRAIPDGSEARRREWIERFMATHPNERESLAPLIVNYLLEKTRR